MINFYKKLLLLLLIFFSLIFKANAIDTKADSAVVLDVNSNSIIFEKNADIKALKLLNE